MRLSKLPTDGATALGGGWTVRERRKPGRPSRQQRPPYDLNLVINAAVRVFNRRGYEASSMADVARETGLSKSSLYHYVVSKEELLARALERAFEALLAVLDESEAQRGTPLDRLRHIVHRVVLITLAFTPEVELLQRIKGNTPTERDALARRHRVDQAVEAIVEEAVRAGQLHVEIAPGLTTRLIFGMTNSLTQWYTPDGKLSADAIAEAVTALVFTGISERGHPAVRHAVDDREEGC